MLSQNVSKLDLINFIRKTYSQKYEVLCIGDRGKWPGNDFELLNTPYSLSVDETSENPNNCWNFLPLQHKGELGSISYLKSFRLGKGYFEFNPKFSEFT